MRLSKTGPAGRKCSNCFQVKPVSEFYRKLRGHQCRCKACQPEVQRAWYRRSRAKALQKGWDLLHGRAG